MKLTKLQIREMIREELEKYDGGFTDEWNDQRKKNAEVLGYKLAGTSDISEEITDWQGKYDYGFKFKKGQLIKDINPDCPHHGSEGEITKVTKDEVTYTVRNNGKTYKVGDELTKTKDQLTPLSINEGVTKYHIRLTDTLGWYGVWDKKGKQKFEGDKRFIMKHLKKLKTRMGNFQLKSLIGVATKRKGKDIEFDVVESVNEGGMGILDKDQTDVLHAIVMKNKNKNSKSILSIAMKDRMFKGVDKKELLGYIEGAKQFVKYMSMGRTGDESVSETKGRDYKAEYQARKSNYYEKYQSSTKAKKYRAELNQYNRKRGTYGNGDGMDASHKGGKIVGFEKESTNRSRREKSRLKKENIRESINEAVEPQGNMAKIAKIVKRKQATKLSGVMIDMQSANLLMKLWDAVSDKDKEKMNKMNARLLTTVIKKLWSRVNLKLPI